MVLRWQNGIQHSVHHYLTTPTIPEALPFSSKLQNDIHRSLHSYWTFTILFTITEWPSPVSSQLKSDILQSLHDYRMALTILFAITECHSPFSPSLQIPQPPFCSPLENDTHHYVRHYIILYRITYIHHSPRHYKMTLTIMFIITK